MDRIAPLAKILAEANGIDWQKLQGSGAGGLIVEQDILNYLSRVMSGEEDPPSTPVDLPPPDWNGEEVPTADMLDRAGMSADLLSRAGVDTDLTAFVEQTRAAAPSTPEPAPESLEDDALEFELDDEPEEAAPVAAQPAPDFDLPVPEAAPAAPAFDLPAVTAEPESAPTPAPEVAPAASWNWGTPAAPAAAEPEPTPAVMPESAERPESTGMPASFAAAEPEPAPVAEAPAAEPEVSAPAAAAPAAGGLASGLGSLLSRLYQKPAEPAPVAEVAAPSEPTPEPVATQPEPEVAAPAAQPEPTPAEPMSTEAVPTEEPSAPDQAGPAVTIEDGPVAEPVMPEVQPVAAEAEAAQPEALESEEAPEPEVAAEIHAEPEVEDIAAEAEVEAVQPEVSEPEQPAMSEPVPVAAAAQDEPVAAPMPAPAAPAGNAVWFGAYLRRDANVAALHDLRGQVTAALSRDLPLALLVARAAARHADSLGLGSVAVHADGGPQAVGSGSLRDALDAGAFDGTPELLVVDAGSMDLDDLHFPHTTTLSVGRVQDGRAALTLNGDVDAARAAQFLAQVAGTLEQPILLVL